MTRHATETPPSAAAPASCPNCAACVIDRYCGACGQKYPVAEDRQLRHFLTEAGMQLVQIDGKLWQTFKYLVLKPGQLSAFDIAGVRRRFMSPLAIFLAVMVLYFYKPTMTDFALPLSDQYIQWYGAWARAYVDSLQLVGSAYTDYAERFWRQETDLARSLVLLHAPLLALWLWALHANKKLRFVDHLVVALHFWALLVIYSLLLQPLLLGIGMLLAQLQISEQAAAPYLVWVLIRIPFLLFLLLTIKNAYQQTWPAALWRFPLAFAGLMCSHFLYRGILFVLTIAQL